MRCCLEQTEVCQPFASIYVSLVHRDDGMRLEWTWFYDDYTMICGDDYAFNVPGERSACLSCLGFFLPRKASKPLSLTKLLDLWELFLSSRAYLKGASTFTIRKKLAGVSSQLCCRTCYETEASLPRRLND